jgi:transcriptional regulator with XRE-family HTH domain
MKALIRIGDKLINRQKINSVIDRILELRATGLSQREVAKRLGLERTFISRVEGLGEIRQGQRIALIGFPVLNKPELNLIAEEMGVEFTYLLTDQERWSLVLEKQGLDFLNFLMNLIMQLRTYDVVVVIGSNLRINMAKTLLDKEVVPLYLGESPIEGDKWVDPELLRQIIQACQQKTDGLDQNERGSLLEEDS